MIAKLLNDVRGIASVCGVATAARWLLQVAISAPEVLRDRDLLSADRKMGSGPFKVFHRLGSAKVSGPLVFAGIREVWVRECYDRGTDILRLPPNATVVDLGANLGNFSMLALAINPTARVVAVEAGADMIELMAETARLNNFQERLLLCRGILGSVTGVQQEMLTEPRYEGVKTITEQDFVTRYDIDRIDYLKCDIEGSEFALLESDSRLLDLSDRVAIEVHNWGGDPDVFIAHLKERGFEFRDIVWDGGSCIVLAEREFQPSSQ